MQKEFYKFKIGAFECIAVNDGGLNYPLEVFFSNAPIEEVKASLRQQGLTTEHIHTPYTCLFINTGQNQIMIDTGAGDIARDAHNFFPTIDNTNARSGKLAENLQAAGIELDQVDTVIITHAHPDHYLPQQYLPKELLGTYFYTPSTQGYEAEVQARLDAWRAAQRAALGITETETLPDLDEQQVQTIKRRHKPVEGKSKR